MRAPRQQAIQCARELLVASRARRPPRTLRRRTTLVRGSFHHPLKESGREVRPRWHSARKLDLVVRAREHVYRNFFSTSFEVVQTRGTIDDGQVAQFQVVLRVGFRVMTPGELRA